MSDSGSSLASGRAVALAGASIVAVSAVITSTPGLAWLDAGDFTTAAVTLGVPHPTGFPALNLFGHLASYLPVGNLASRAALPSAAFSAGAAGLLILLASRFCRSLAGLVAVASSLVLVFHSSPNLFVHARVPEAYALNLLVLAAGLSCVERFAHTGDERWRLGLALILGFGAAHHGLLRLLGIVLVSGSLTMRRPLPAVRVWLSGAALAVVGALVVLYLPLAAARGPMLNWGDPSTPGRFFDHVTASSIQQAFRSQMFPGGYALRVHAVTLLKQLWEASGLLLPIGVTGLSVGAVLLRRAERRTVATRLAALIGLLAITEIIYSVAINPMGLRDSQNGQISHALLPLCGAFTLVALAEGRLSRSRPRLVSLALVAPALLAPSLHHPHWSMGRDFAAEDLAVIFSGTAEPESLGAFVSDSMIAGQVYAQYALHARPDSAFMGRNQITSGPRFAYEARRQPFEVVPPETLARWEEDDRGLTLHQLERRATWIAEQHVGRRPVYWEIAAGSIDLDCACPITPGWPIASVGPRDASVHIPAARSLRTGEEDVTFAARSRRAAGAKQLFYRRWLASKWGAIGSLTFDSNRPERALSAFQTAARLDPDNDTWITNAAVCQAAQGELDRALALCLKALEINPLSTTAAQNGLLYSEALRDTRSAEFFADRLSRLE